MPENKGIIFNENQFQTASSHRQQAFTFNSKSISQTRVGKNERREPHMKHNLDISYYPGDMTQDKSSFSIPQVRPDMDEND